MPEPDQGRSFDLTLRAREMTDLADSAAAAETAARAVGLERLRRKLIALGRPDAPPSDRPDPAI